MKKTTNDTESFIQALSNGSVVVAEPTSLESEFEIPSNAEESHSNDDGTK